MIRYVPVGLAVVFTRNGKQEVSIHMDTEKARQAAARTHGELNDLLMRVEEVLPPKDPNQLEFDFNRG